MDTPNNSILVNSKDNVCTATQELKEGSTAVYWKRGQLVETLTGFIPIYHKFACIDIQKGDFIIKYGEIIGIATEDIKAGSHVHDHNIMSIGYLNQGGYSDGVSGL